MTEFNTIVRRPHLPRERALRRLLGETGHDLASFGPEPLGEADEEAEEADDYEEDQSEGGESEEAAEDDPCALA